MITIVLLLAGLIGLTAGGELLVRGAVATAHAYRISPMFTGVALVGFGTSAPELVTSVQAALAGSPGIAIGNVVGSNIGNILLILGAGALLAPIAVDPAALKRDGGAMAVATCMCLAAILFGEINRIIGLVFVSMLIAYLTLTFLRERASASEPGPQSHDTEGLAAASAGFAVAKSIALAVAGLVLIVLGARALVFGALQIAQSAGISETAVGLTIVAIGTSLPELATSVIAVRKGHGDVALGNIIGSTIFNIWGILGITALVHPMLIPPAIISFDIWVMCATGALLIVTARTGWTVTRLEGAVLIGLYALYLWMVWR